MQKYLLIFSLGIIFSTISFAQPKVADPEKKDFMATLGFLSSEWMEGREAGSKGSFLAADYIFSQMMQLGLKPGSGVGRSQIFFQDFDIVRYKTTKSGFTLIDQVGRNQSRKGLISDVDYVNETGPADFHFEAPLVFVGYGISASHLGYNDYSKIDVTGCIVVVLDGFPGEKDTLSPGWKKFGSKAVEEVYSEKAKQRNATGNGALAMILVSPGDGLVKLKWKQVNKSIAKSAFRQVDREDLKYEDYNYTLPGDTASIPVCWLIGEASVRLLAGSGINLKKTAKRISARLIPESTGMKGKLIGLSAGVKAEPLFVRNVLGHIQGADTNNSIVIGAHYDHLGLRDDRIYNGADDNASGVAGMLAIAASRIKSGDKPPCNIIFAAWTAEEKGLPGSTWFVRNFDFSKQKILLNVNFDMISGSAEEDTERKVISIGLLKGTDKLKEIASSQNRTLKKPFELDLWETSGGGGSDYAPFATGKIPVMSFFSGYHHDYRTPRDVYSKTDPVKMEAILKLANRMILEFLTTQIL
jgi:hypothetical protein